jgi:predicted 2-oxoglutarate/Fe(II)-dependent dioxygenase YbiX
VETAHLMVEKAEIMQATKLAAEEKKLSKFWSKSESTRLSKLEKKESIRSTNTFFWSQSVPDEDSARKKNLQQLDKNFQKIPATERNKITSRKARLK